MRTLLPNPPPPEFEDLLEQRRRLGNDRFDEVWDGVLHVNPAPQGRHGYMQTYLAETLAPLARTVSLTMVAQFNLGEKVDYRVPDSGLIRGEPDRLYFDTAALVIEIVSPNDESWEKLSFYAEHNVDEVLIVDAQERAVHWLGRENDSYAPIERSTLIDLRTAELSGLIDWPPAG